MGLGQCYNRQGLKGGLLILLEALFFLVLGGFVPHAVRGLITLGNVAGQDNSLFLMVEGLIAAIIGAFVLVIYAVNVRDAYMVGQLRDAGLAVPNFKATLRRLGDKGFPLILLAPGTLLLCIGTLLPLLFSLALAFTNYDLRHSPPANLVEWVGFSNFVELLSLGSWQNTMVYTLGWTVAWTLLATVSTFALGFFYAVLLNNPALKFRSFFRTMLILPWAVPAFVSLLVFTGMFNGTFGVMNDVLNTLGLPSVPWFTEVFWARVMMLLVNLYLGFPFFMVLCSGVLQGINTDLYEAAEIDGANGWQRFSSITFPLVMYSVYPLLIMSLAVAFNNFNAVYLLTGGGPAVAGLRGAGGTDILISWVFKLTFETLYQFNYAAAISTMIFIFVALVSVWGLRKTKQFQEETVGS